VTLIEHLDLQAMNIACASKDSSAAGKAGERETEICSIPFTVSVSEKLTGEVCGLFF
jgi:hypothetical protein